MMIQQYPKQKTHKAQKIRNPAPTINDLCEVCGKPYAATHEIFFGEKHRRLSQIYGLTKRLCYEHHNKPYGDNPHYNKAIDSQYKQEGQKRFEERYSRDEFYKVFGRYYI
jgi:hypothetical protein